MRIGIYGGSFDPVHLGHLLVAEMAREQARLDQVLFVPAHQSPLKVGDAPADGKARIEMLELALAGHPSFFVDRREIDRQGISYTVDTLRDLHREQPQAEWFFLMGADSLSDFHRWRDPSEICRLAVPLIVARGGYPPPVFEALSPFVDRDRLETIRAAAIEMPQIEISSRDLRQRVAFGRSIRYQVPASVEAYIRTHELYRCVEG